MNHSNWNSCIDYARNEIVFENRNKSYGAYVIRRDYTQNVLLAFFTACFFMVILFTPVWLKSMKNQQQIISEKFNDVINVEIFSPPPVEITPPPATTPVMPSQSVKENSDIRIVKDHLATPVVEMTELNAASIQPMTEGGSITTNGLIGNSIPVIPDVLPEAAPKVWVENMPKFPGGDKELFNYMSRHIHYPKKALSNNIEGTVYVSFIVDTTGLITNVKLIHGIDEACDLEAIRAVQNMPKWIPGSQNNNKVRVQMNLPVRFIIQ